MKKIILFIAAIFGIFAANAQFARTSSTIPANNTKKIPFVRVPVNRVTHRISAKTTSITTLTTENFGTGTPVSLPTGWTAGAFAGGTWHWANTASTSAYSLGVMNSTTAYNGWMIFDADSIGTACSCTPAGWLQSPAYNCDTDTVVCLNFEDYYEKFNDSCYVWVSTSPTFTTYTSYQVAPNNSLINNVTTANPVKVHINISPVAAGQSAVYIRFVYYCNAGHTGGYSWMIDDMSLAELGPHDVGIGNSFMYEQDTSAYFGSVFNTPLVFVDSVYPVTMLSNYGVNGQSNIKVTAVINAGTASLYTQVDSLDSISVNTCDSILRFPAYLPDSIAGYNCSFDAIITGDANPADNSDNILFNVTDTLWQQNTGQPTMSYYIYGFPDSTPVSYFQGTRFDVPSISAGDTVSGFGVAFDPGSSPTTGSAVVSVQLYSIKQGETHWTYVATSEAKAIKLGDISTPTSLVWADFRIDPVSSGGITPFILHSGTTYAVVVHGNGVTTNLIVYATNAFSHNGYTPGFFGQSDTSYNDGSTNFGMLSNATGIAGAIPLVRMYFGNIPAAYTSVQNIDKTDNYVGAAYPDPANTMVSIPFNMTIDARVTVTLFNMVGQIMKIQSIEAIGGQPMKATFETNDLPDGVYLYSVNANGEYANGRIVITH